MGGVTRTGITQEELALEGAPDEEILARRKAMYEELVHRGVWKGNACGPVYDDDFERLAVADLAAANGPARIAKKITAGKRVPAIYDTPAFRRYTETPSSVSAESMATAEARLGRGRPRSRAVAS